MAEEMQNADLAISACSDTFLEMLSIGLPTILVNHHERQNKLGEFFEKRGATINLGIGVNMSENKISNAVNEIMNDYEKRKCMSTIGKKFIDRKGAEKVANKIMDSIKQRMKK
jgi:spore coat polysaccharide biosynthesis predicted glycosyltransferase SpsG